MTNFAQDSDLLLEDLLAEVQGQGQVDKVVRPARDVSCLQGNNSIMSGSREWEEKPSPVPLPLVVQPELTTKCHNDYLVIPRGTIQS